MFHIDIDIDIDIGIDRLSPIKMIHTVTSSLSIEFGVEGDGKRLCEEARSKES